MRMERESEAEQEPTFKAAEVNSVRLPAGAQVHAACQRRVAVHVVLGYRSSGGADQRRST